MLPAAAPALSRSELVISPAPSAYFGVGAVGRLPGLVRASGDAAVVVTDAALAATTVVAGVAGVLWAAGMPVLSLIHI